MTTRHWLVVLSLLLGAATAHAGEPRRVLVLYSNGRLVPANIEVEHEISRVLAGTSGKTVQILSDFLEFTDFPEPSYEPTLTTYLHEKYSARRPDVVVAVARESLDYVLRHRADLFPGVPIVHTGVFKSYLDKHPAMPADVLGVPVEYDAADTIEQALRWHPSARRLVMITATSRGKLRPFPV